MRHTTTLGTAAVAAVLSAVALAGPAHAAPPKSFANCDAMHHVYPHGVGRPGAHDHTSGTPVTTFKRSSALYDANHGSDRDGDGIACEAL